MAIDDIDVSVRVATIFGENMGHMGTSISSTLWWNAEGAECAMVVWEFVPSEIV